MIISHKHKFIFLKTRKTAGTSIEIALSKHCGPEDIITPISLEDEKIRKKLGCRGPQRWEKPLKHYNKNDFKKLIKKRKLPRLFYNHIPAEQIITLVGEKLYNDYFKFCVERNPFDRAISYYFYAMRNYQDDEKQGINEFIKNASYKKLSNWEIYTMNEEVVVDYICKHETLQEDLKKICSMIGLPDLELPQAKSGFRNDRSHYKEVLSKEAIKHIQQVCRKEIEYLDYSY